LFWYKACCPSCGPRQGLMLPFGSNLSNRGLLMRGHRRSTNSA
jgi:hypothetical protein